MAATRVADENKRLRELLNQYGVNDECIAHYLQATAANNSESNQGQTIRPGEAGMATHTSQLIVDHSPQISVPPSDYQYYSPTGFSVKPVVAQLSLFPSPTIQPISIDNRRAMKHHNYPLTFEPTFKDLAGISPPLASSSEEDETQIIVSETLLQADIEDLSIPPDSLHTGVAGKTQSHSYPTAAAHDFDALSQQFKLPPVILLEDYCSLDGSIMERLKICDPYERLSKARSYPSPELRALYKPGTHRLTDEALADRNRKTEQWWYSGISKAYKNTADTSLSWTKPHMPGGIGVIGDKRPQAPLRPSEKRGCGESNRNPKVRACKAIA